MQDVVLQPGRDRSVRLRHPWLLSGSLARAPEGAAPGAAVRVLSAEGEVLGYGHLSPASQIRVRLSHFTKEEPEPDWIAARIARAVARRAADPLLAGSDAVRLINAEGDGLPGLTVDRYADCAVARLASAGMDARREEIAAVLRETCGASHGFERADAASARREGVAVRQGALFGTPPESAVAIDERGRRYEVDVLGGQKTGFYLDQRDARDLVERLAAGRRVLDAFAYTGGFGVAAARGGAASITALESSAPALARAREHLAANGAVAPEFVQADAFQWLRGTDTRYDLLILDPPPLARRRRDLPRAARALRELLEHALRRADDEALLLAFRCSHALDDAHLRSAVFGAARATGRTLQVLARLGLPSDHPVALDHPEGEYYSGLLLRVAA